MISKWWQKRKLVSLVKELAIYNDKGIEWRHHDERQREAERDRLMQGMESQIALLGAETVPSELHVAIRSGALRTDITGDFVPYAKAAKL